jgi:IMP dehydrogenase
MVHDVATVDASATLNDALHQMWMRDLGALPVVDAGQVIGMITDRDIAMSTYLQGRVPAQIPVRSAMSRSLWTCGPDDPVHQAEELLREHRIRRLPVLDTSRLVGMVTFTDLVRASSRGAWKVAAGHLARTLDRITSART